MPAAGSPCESERWCGSAVHERGVLSGGEVPGDHEVIFSSPTERLVLSHSVTTRTVFAEGALRAARWVSGQRPGLYDMHDVLFGNNTD